MTTETQTPEQQRRAEVVAELATRSMYELLGAEGGIRAIVDTFYDVMDRDPEFASIRTMHQADLGPMRVGLFEYLSGWLGGPPLYVERKGSPCMTSAHRPFAIGPAARDLWLGCMNKALVEADVAEKYRELLTPAFERMAHMIQNRD